MKFYFQNLDYIMVISMANMLTLHYHFNIFILQIHILTHYINILYSKIVDDVTLVILFIRPS